MRKSNILFIFFFISAVSCLPAQDVEHSFLTAEEVITSLYNLVTFDAGTTPDWDRVRSLFLPEAVVVLRTSRESTSVFSVEGFVDDFIQFIERAEAEKTGFREEIISMKPMIFGDMADIWVLYEASIPGSQRPPQQGVDFFSLIKKEGQWVIVSVTNEIPTSERPVPEIF
ncbi:MAG: hypothetical protein AMS27_09190 [Bacteroides sp. SM23_62_1]|nr:MAG: hypothetical protein AMS27_09190 [Bacteroides sp. SM23_62_1]